MGGEGPPYTHSWETPAGRRLEGCVPRTLQVPLWGGHDEGPYCLSGAALSPLIYSGALYCRLTLSLLPLNRGFLCTPLGADCGGEAGRRRCWGSFVSWVGLLGFRLGEIPKLPPRRLNKLGEDLCGSVVAPSAVTQWGAPLSNGAPSEGRASFGVSSPPAGFLKSIGGLEGPD